MRIPVVDVSVFSPSPTSDSPSLRRARSRSLDVAFLATPGPRPRGASSSSVLSISPSPLDAAFLGTPPALPTPPAPPTPSAPPAPPISLEVLLKTFELFKREGASMDTIGRVAAELIEGEMSDEAKIRQVGDGTISWALHVWRRTRGFFTYRRSGGAAGDAGGPSAAASAADILILGRRHLNLQEI